MAAPKVTQTILLVTVPSLLATLIPAKQLSCIHLVDPPMAPSLMVRLSNQARSYGTTVYGGAYSDDNRFIGGTIFAYNLDTGKEIVLHSFGHGTDGNIPCGSLIKLGSILYGMTSGGGAYDSGKPFSGGTIFAYNISTNAETILYSFAGGKDGANPIGALTESGSILYGVTSRGGAGRDGTIFAYNINTSMEKVLHSFGSSA